MKKMNNKGFSLVELIVVVLIMAIIAVALAPQVMKWVENSRKSTDIENYNALVEAANVAATNEKVIAEIGTGSVTITMKSESLAGAGNKTTTCTGGTAFKTALANTLPGWDDTKVTSGTWANSAFTIVVENNGGNGVKVTKSAFPTKDFD